ncbi:MAG TPA: hypothetical protein VFM79_10460 [Pelobium sp.]|nr:hypothetical protein [Pelobium sp.]
METNNDQKDIEKAKQLINEQVEETKKLNLGLDADGSTKNSAQRKSKFDGFINNNDLPPLDEK